MSDDQERNCQARTEENGKPSGQTVDVFNLEWQILIGNRRNEQMNKIRHSNP